MDNTAPKFTERRTLPARHAAHQEITDLKAQVESLNALLAGRAAPSAPATMTPTLRRALQEWGRAPEGDEDADAAVLEAIAGVPAAAGEMEALATITFGGIDGDELGEIDFEVTDMRRLEAIQYNMVRTSDPVYLTLYGKVLAAAPASPHSECWQPASR